MAADETYNTIVYHESGGDRLVFGSGGTLAIESGGSMLVANSGTMTLASGMDLSIIPGATIGVAGGDLTPSIVHQLVVSEQLMDSFLPLGAATTLTASNLPKNLNTYTIWASATLVSASFWLTSVSAGREVFLLVAGDSTGAFTNKLTQVDVSMSGCICLGSVGTAISRFHMNASAASDALVHLMAVADNVWAIMHVRGDVDEINN